jgi:hypothetical protein
MCDWQTDKNRIWAASLGLDTRQRSCMIVLAGRSVRAWPALTFDIRWFRTFSPETRTERGKSITLPNVHTAYTRGETDGLHENTIYVTIVFSMSQFTPDTGSR